VITGDRQLLEDLYGTWNFTYTIISTWTDRFRLQSVYLSDRDGEWYLEGDYTLGLHSNPVIVSVAHDISEYTYALLNWNPIGVIFCDFFLFNKIGTNTVAGLYVPLDENCDPRGSLDYYMSRRRISTARSALLGAPMPEEILDARLALDEAKLELKRLEAEFVISDNDLGSASATDPLYLETIIRTLVETLRERREPGTS
jgi:hypothetical protein